MKMMKNKMFTGSKPIEGIAKKALELAIKKSGKTKPTLKDRR